MSTLGDVQYIGVFNRSSGGVPPSVVCPCLHGAVCHCQKRNNLVI